MIPFGISDSKYTNIDFEHVNVSLPIELDFSTPDREIVFSRNSRGGIFLVAFWYKATYSGYGEGKGY